MCRHLAYLGPPVTLASLLYEAPHGLVDQARHSRHQASGRENPDGWGVGWWPDDPSSAPRRYRSARPMWEDTSFAGPASSERSRAIVAAVRLASPGLPVEETGNAPFSAGRWLFSFNGSVKGFGERGPVEDALRGAASPTRLAGIEGASDSELLFALVLDRLDAGAAPAEAVADVVHLVEATSGGRLNLLLADGTAIVATAAGNSLFARAQDGSVVVASEPFDDDPAWERVPDRRVLHADPGGWSAAELGPRLGAS